MSNRKINWKHILRIAIEDIGIILLGSVLGLAALWIVYLIPVDKMHQNTERSMAMLQREFDNSQKIIDYEASLAGTFTDCIMLEHAIYQSEEHSRLELMLNMYRGETAEGDYWVPGFSLLDYVNGTPQPREVTYARYWHGYLVLLKPLLYFSYFNSMRVSGAIIQFIAIGLVFLLCTKRKENMLGMAFFVSMPFMFQFTMYFSLSLSICFYLMIGCVLYQLWRHDELGKKNGYARFFLVAGILTAYFDFLTYPLIVLAYPLGICLYLNRDSWLDSFKKLVFYSFQWGLGYGLYWAMKWVIADVILHTNTIADGIGTFFTRVDSAENKSKLMGFFYVIKRNLSMYQSFGFVLLTIAILGVLGYLVYQNRKTAFCKDAVLKGLVMAIVAFMPFAWFFVTQNHSEQHYMYTCKILAICAFGAVCTVGKMLQEPK